MADLLQVIKRAALDAVHASSPMEVRFGTVVELEPLTVETERRMRLWEDILIVPESLKRYEIDVSHLHNTNCGADGASASTDFALSEPLVIREGLQLGDKVILLRVQGGEKYLVVDKEERVAEWPEFELGKTLSLTFEETSEYIYKFIPATTKEYTFTVSPKGDSVVYTDGLEGEEALPSETRIEVYDNVRMTTPLVMKTGQVNVMLDAGKMYYLKFTRKGGESYAG